MFVPAGTCLKTFRFCFCMFLPKQHLLHFAVPFSSQVRSVNSLSTRQELCEAELEGGLVASGGEVRFLEAMTWFCFIIFFWIFSLTKRPFVLYFWPGTSCYWDCGGESLWQEEERHRSCLEEFQRGFTGDSQIGCPPKYCSGLDCQNSTFK